MAITQTIYEKTVQGNKRVHFARFTKSNPGTSESFTTGLKRVSFFTLDVTSSGTADASNHRIGSGSDFPLNSGSVTVHFSSGTVTGIWKAEGL